MFALGKLNNGALVGAWPICISTLRLVSKVCLPNQGEVHQTPHAMPILAHAAPAIPPRTSSPRVSPRISVRGKRRVAVPGREESPDQKKVRDSTQFAPIHKLYPRLNPQLLPPPANDQVATRRSWGRCTHAMPAKTHQRTLPAAAPRACSLGAGCQPERLPGWSSLGRPPSGSFRLRQQVREPSFQPSASSACGCSLEEPEMLRVDTLIPVST